MGSGQGLAPDPHWPQAGGLTPLPSAGLWSGLWEGALRVSGCHDPTWPTATAAPAGPVHPAVAARVGPLSFVSASGDRWAPGLSLQARALACTQPWGPRASLSAPPLGLWGALSRSPAPHHPPCSLSAGLGPAHLPRPPSCTQQVSGGWSLGSCGGGVWLLPGQVRNRGWASVSPPGCGQMSLAWSTVVLGSVPALGVGGMSPAGVAFSMGGWGGGGRAGAWGPGGQCV